MKKFLALFLALILCFSLLVACKPEEPDNGGTTPPAGDSSGDNGGNNGGDSGNNGGDSGNNGGDSGNNGGDSGNTGGDNTVVVGERVTAEQWAAMTVDGAKPFSNYTASMSEADADGENTAISMMIDGAEYIISVEMNGTSMKFGAFLMDGTLRYYTYQADSGKWFEQASEGMMASLAKSYPMAGCPYPFSDFAFNEETGIYTCTYYEDAEDTEPEYVEACFKSGALVFIKITEGDIVSQMSAKDHGTTVVPRPTAEEIGTSGPSVTGNEVTAELWASQITAVSANYTCKYNVSFLGMTVSQLVKMANGMYWSDSSASGGELAWGEILDDGIVGYIYNAETGKWDYDDYADSTYSNADILSAFPLDFALYTYNAELGAYVYELAEAGYVTTYIVVFQNGKLVSFYMETGSNISGEYIFSNVGTTTITRPAAEDLMPPASSAGEVIGEEITAEEWAAILSATYTNYTYLEWRGYADGSEDSIYMMVAGEEYIEEAFYADGSERVLGGFLMDGRIRNYEYNSLTEKWEHSNTGIAVTYPLNSLPFDFSLFTYDALSGIYCYEMTMGDETATIELGFLDGVCVYLGTYSGATYRIVSFYDYGTTVIDRPTADEIVNGNGGIGTII